MNQFDWWVLNDSFAKISAQSIASNFRTGPMLDNDDFLINFVGHPFLGAIPFEAARSSGLGFWESVPYTVVADLAWEFLGETQAPSINDLVESGVGGIVWGEAFHRISELVLEDDEIPWPLRLICVLPIDPSGALNNAILGSTPHPRSELRGLWHARLYLGALVLGETPTRAQVLVGADFTYGFPDKPDIGCVHPFDHFDLEADGGFAGTTTIDAYLRGLIAGCRYGRQSIPGAWGLFGLSDYGTAAGFRVDAIALGPGTLLQWQPSSRFRMKVTVIAAGVAIGAAGTLAEADYVDPTGGVPWKPSKYSMGPGAEGVVDLELTLAERVTLRLTGRSWWLDAITPFRGLLAWLPAYQFAGLEGSVQQRLPAQPYDQPLTGWTARIMWGVRLGTEPGP
jgi:hypothetical protein